METVNKNNLSEREREVMELVSRGKQNKDIANVLDCKTSTVKKHMRHIFIKLGVKNRTQAFLKFMEITGRLNPEIELNQSTL